MNNQRRRKEVLVVAEIMGSCAEIIKDKKYTQLAQFGPLPYLSLVDGEFTRNVPDPKQRHSELQAAQKVVNDIFSPAIWSWPVSVRLWAGCQLVHRLCLLGWVMPKDGSSSKFIQATYDLSHRFNPAVVPDVNITEKYLSNENLRLRAAHNGVYGLK